MKGQSIPYEFYQKHNLQRNRDLVYGKMLEGLLSDDSISNASILIAYSQATFHEAGTITETLTGTPYFSDEGFIEPDVDYHGRSFFEYDGVREAGDFGHIEAMIPTLINVNYGISSLQIRKAYDIKHQHTSAVPVPVVSNDEYTNSKFNRFTKDSVKAYVTTEHNAYKSQGVRLIIGPLQSMFTKPSNQGSTLPPERRRAIPYKVSMRLLLNDPTLASTWNNDNITYPIPTYLIKELTTGVLSMIQIQKSLPADNITDNADTTTIIQPQTQRKVRNSA
jgi:hypothetical protein